MEPFLTDTIEIGLAKNLESYPKYRSENPRTNKMNGFLLSIVILNEDSLTAFREPR
jgi:hypothetical protein